MQQKRNARRTQPRPLGERLKLAVNLARTPAEPVAQAERVMDCGGKRSATPRFDRRPACDATEAVRAAESGAAFRGSPQSKNTTSGAPATSDHTRLRLNEAATRRRRRSLERLRMEVDESCCSLPRVCRSMVDAGRHFTPTPRSTVNHQLTSSMHIKKVPRTPA
jgi:hypothetical protein